MEWLTDPNIWIALVSLTSLEIVLGIDNIIFIIILTERLPAPQQAKARTVGLTLAMVMRIALLFSITLIMRLTTPLFEILGAEISGRDIILVVGGLFLIGKSTFEIHERIEGPGSRSTSGKNHIPFTTAIIQILLIDMVFSIDSVITAIGMTTFFGVMVAAIVIAVGVMLLSINAVGGFVQRNPTIKMLALSFLILIGVLLVAEGFDQHIPRGYIYFAMAFSAFVELLNMKARRVARAPVSLHEPYAERAGKSPPTGSV